MFPIDFTDEIGKLKQYYICECGNKYSFDAEYEQKYCSECSREKSPGKIGTHEWKELKVIDRILSINKACHQKSVSDKQISVANLELFVKFYSPVKHNSRGENEFHKLCKKNAAVQLKTCLDKNIDDINHKDYAGWAPLHEAIENNSVDCVRILLEAGALPSIPGLEYTTPLHKAVITGNTEVIQLLLQYGADKDTLDYWGRKPVDYSNNTNITSLFDNLVEVVTCPVKTIYIPNDIHIFICKNVRKEITNKLKNFKGLCHNVQNATHLIVDRDETIDINVLHAILKGIFVYKEQWINQFNGKPEVSPLYLNLVPSSKSCFKEALRNRLLKNPELFNGINFHITGHKTSVVIQGTTFTRQDLITLVTAGGGTILKREPTVGTVESANAIAYHLKGTKYVECRYYVIYDHRDPPVLLYNMKELLHKSSEWLVNCILEFKFI